MRQRTEQRALEMVQTRKIGLEARVREALAAGNETLAMEGATAIADFENEEDVRAETVARLADKVKRLRVSVEKAHRRVVDLRQGAVTARAIDMERKSQRRIVRAINGSSAIEEAEALIRRVADQDDPLEHAEIAEEIDASLSHKATEDRLAAAGFGPQTKVRPEDVLARLKATPKTPDSTAA
jgi:phage shock protein A